jgi:hypothetical protein
MRNEDTNLKSKAEHAQKYFYGWSQKTLDDETINRIQAHLKICQECQQYYEKMTAVLDQPDLSVIPRLIPDPLLAEKIIHRFEHPIDEKRINLVPRYIRWSFATIVVVLSFSLGILLGSSIFHNADRNYESQLTSAYYQHFSQSSILEEFDQIINFVSEDQQ